MARITNLGSIRTTSPTGPRFDRRRYTWGQLAVPCRDTEALHAPTPPLTASCPSCSCSLSFPTRLVLGLDLQLRTAKARPWSEEEERRHLRSRLTSKLSTPKPPKSAATQPTLPSTEPQEDKGKAACCTAQELPDPRHRTETHRRPSRQPQTERTRSESSTATRTRLLPRKEAASRSASA